MLFSQETRSLAVSTDLGPEVLVIKSMTGNEQLSTLFRYHLKLLSENAELQPEDMLSTPVTVRLNIPGGGHRYFNGIVNHFVFTGFDGVLATYEAILVPWTWHLTCKANHRIFQDKSVPEIVETIFNEHRYADFEYRLEGSYSKRDYCVQYGETDFTFITRLLAQEGIYYFFTHQKDGHIMILADNDYAHERITGYEEIPYYPPDQAALRERDHIKRWSMAGTVQPGAFTHTDFNPLSPRTDLTAFDVFHHENDFTDFEFFEYPGGYAKREQGKQWAKVRTEEINVGFKTFSGAGDARGLTTGMRFALTGYPRKDQNREYLILAAKYRLNSDAFGSSGNAGGAAGSEPPFYCKFAALDAEIPYRPPRPTKKPVIQGPQTAIVVGKAGEEIWTDQYGRVKVQFHWDRYGKSDEHSSCWVRVSQAWAGKGWGAMSVPRIGQEVVVDFLEGDPDRPIITGRVYNGVNLPAHGLPGGAVISGLRSESTKGGGGYNEYVMDDTKGNELIREHGQYDKDSTIEHDLREHVLNDRSRDVVNDETILIGKDRSKTVVNDETTNIRHDRKETVDNNETISIGKDRKEKVGNDETINIVKDRKEKVGNDETIRIGHDRKETVSNDETINIGHDRRETVANNESISIGKDATLSVGENLFLDAGDSVTIRTGKASISMKKDGTITIQGKDITVKGSGVINAKATKNVVIKGKKILEN